MYRRHVPEVQLQASAVVQPVGSKALLLLAEGHCQHTVGACAHIHTHQTSHLLLPAKIDIR